MTPNTIDERYLVRSVSRAAEILELLANSADGLTVTEVGRLAGGSKSSVFSTLQTLEAHRLVASEGEGPRRRYFLGLALARYGELAVNRVSIREVALPVLRELADQTQLSARVARPEHGEVVIVGRVDAPNAVRFDLHMGQRELPHCSGLGKAVTAQLDDDEARAVLEATGMPARTARTITDPETLMAQLAEVRKRGYAIDDEEDADGIFCIGAAVLNHRGDCAGAISVTGLKVGVTKRRMREVGEVVRDHADRISALLGRG